MKNSSVMRRAAASLLVKLCKTAYAGSGNQTLQVSNVLKTTVSCASQSPALWFGQVSRVLCSTSNTNSLGLADILVREIQYEKESYVQPESLRGGPPPPFTLTESKGDAILALSSKHGRESILVELECDAQPSEDALQGDELDVEIEPAVDFTVTITKDNENLVFECRSDGSYIDILMCTLEPSSPWNGESDDENVAAYKGPDAQELDEDLNAAFIEYLAGRGINAEFGAYLVSLAYDKEVREYAWWLERVLAFVKK